MIFSVHVFTHGDDSLDTAAAFYATVKPQYRKEVLCCQEHRPKPLGFVGITIRPNAINGIRDWCRRDYWDGLEDSMCKVKAKDTCLRGQEYQDHDFVSSSHPLGSRTVLEEHIPGDYTAYRTNSTEYALRPEDDIVYS